jgi:hypothetical protein
MAFPYSESKLLVNSVSADTTVTLVEGLQVARVTIVSGAGDLGQITLSPVQHKAVDIELKSGAQIVYIDIIEFKSAFGLDNGSVKARGRATDQEVKNEAPFSKEIANWPIS